MDALLPPMLVHSVCFCSLNKLTLFIAVLIHSIDFLLEKTMYKYQELIPVAQDYVADHSLEPINRYQMK